MKARYAYNRRPAELVLIPLSSAVSELKKVDKSHVRRVAILVSRALICLRE